VVAIDTPDNLTSRLRGAETMFLHVAAPEDAVVAALGNIAGVTRVAVTKHHDASIDLEVDSARDVDVRRELAATVVGRGWGLLELRPVRMGLEDIFLKLTEEEEAANTAAAASATGQADAGSEEDVNA
jgi:ABC-2 type transport system ATP-binding protein